MNKKTGIITVSDNKAAVKFERHLAHPIEKVEALTNELHDILNKTKYKS